MADGTAAGWPAAGWVDVSTEGMDMTNLVKLLHAVERAVEDRNIPDAALVSVTVDQVYDSAMCNASIHVDPDTWDGLGLVSAETKEDSEWIHQYSAPVDGVRFITVRFQGAPAAQSQEAAA